MNGALADTPGTKVDPIKDQVTCGGQAVRPPDACTYVLLNKPRGYLVSAGDPHHDRTVFSLLGEVGARVFPVGRLDMDTGGALLLTDDGDLAYRLTHPKYLVDKVYRVGVSRRPDFRILSQLREGVLLDDDRKTAPAQITILGSGSEGTELEISIHEGRNRQIRRMCDVVGLRLEWLERFSFAGLTVEGLARGSWRSLEVEEVGRLRDLVHIGETV